MPESMPYHLETGRTLKAIEDAMNGIGLMETPAAQRTRLRRIANALEAAGTLRAAGNVDPPNLLENQLAGWVAATNSPLPRLGNLTVAEAIRSSWLGPDIATGVYNADGRWLGYCGHVEEILRKTFTDAIRLSLDRTRPNGRPWPFVLIWKCAQPWLEGWVQWRSKPGVVVIVICTPPDGNHIALDPDLDHLTEANPPDNFQSPVTTYHNNGSMVITHDWHEFQAATSCSVLTYGPSTQDDGDQFPGAPLPFFGGMFVGRGPIFAMSPAADDGGVA
jgi:hypothetical protein